MESNNPWQSSASQGNPYTSNSDSQSQQQQYRPPQQGGGYYSTPAGQQQSPWYDPQQRQQQQPPQQQPGHYASNPTSQQQAQWFDQQQQQQPQYYSGSITQQQPPQPQHPSAGIRRSETERLLEQEPDRATQMEYMQSYEAQATQTEDDVNQATLQREFPDIDSSLIAAIYGDTKQMGRTRELLQELSRGGDEGES